MVGGLEVRIIQARVDDTSRAANAEQNRVRTTLQVDATDVITIPRNVAQEVIAGVIGRGQTADAGGRTDGVLCIDLRARHAGIVTAQAGDFRARGVHQQVGGVRRPGVLQELLRYNGN